MKAPKVGILLAIACAMPALSIAQENQNGVTRQKVRAELIELEKAGYDPHRVDDATFPADLQAAEAKVAAQHQQQASSTTTPSPPTPR